MAAKTFLKTKLAILLFVIVACTTVAVGGQIIYVDDDVTGANNGSSWEDAFNYLQDALAVAVDGDEIRVAQGIYKPDQGGGQTPGDRAATFQLINGVTIKGGYAGAGTPDPNARDIELYETILTGDLNGDDGPDFTNNDENSFHVVNGSGTDETGILEGFTITAGNAQGAWLDFMGGGMYNDNGSPALTDCTFRDNWATRGGGMYNYYSSPTLTNCTLSDNMAADDGGGMYNDFSGPILTNCSLNMNSANRGGGMYNGNGNPTITNCTLRGNFALRYGGGMYNYPASITLNNCTFHTNSADYGGGLFSLAYSLTVRNCAFIENSATFGGGIACRTLETMMMNCTFIGNTAQWMAGGIWSCDTSRAMLTNCIFSGNSANSIGGAMVCYKYYEDYRVSMVTLANCTFTGNSATNGNTLLADSEELKYPHDIDISNCILWNGGNEICNLDDSTINISYSDVHSGWPGTGNIDADPMFHDTDGDDDLPGTEDDNLRLLPASPCIDTGDPNYIAEPNETDLDGRHRIIGCRIDMGAYEHGQLVSAGARIVPRTINLASKGKWITCYFWLPEQYNVADIKPGTILLECEIKLESLQVDEQEQVATARFTREDVLPVLEVGDINLKITGQLNDYTVFEATDTIKVVDKTGKN